MIDYINTRLNGWAAWLKSGKRNCLGYPTHAAFARLMPSSQPAGPLVPYLNEEAEEIDRAVSSLPVDVRELLKEFYMHEGPAEAKAKRLKCCRDTLYARLHQAHVRVMEWLQDQYDRAEQKKLVDNRSDTFVALCQR